MLKPLRVLVIEERSSDTLLLSQELGQCGFAPQIQAARTEQHYLGALPSDWDVILADWAASELNPARACEILQQQGSEIPLLVICEQAEEGEVISALQSGATDYVLKSGLGRLGWALHRALGQRAARQASERERKQAELALRQSEEQYRTVVEGAMEGLAIHEDGIIRFANRSAARLSGYDHPRQLVGRDFWETFVAPEARAELKMRCTRALRGEVQPMHPGWPGIRRDGSRVWVQSSVTLVQWQGRPAFLGYFSDITERKKAEELLRASEERFSKAFHGSPLPVSIVTLDEGRYIDANISLVEMVGWTREEILGHTAFDLKLWVEPAQRAELVGTVSQNGVAKNFEARLRMKDGAIRDVLISAERIQLGQDGFMIVVTQDITAQRSLEEQLRQAQKMEAVGQLAGGIAHDFNNLLTIIQGHAAQLRPEESPVETIQEAAEQISLATERAASLVRQLLTFSRRQIMQARELDMNEVIDRTGRMLRRVLGEDIELVCHHAPALPLVHADPGMMEQVLLNLAVNARDAMTRGGQLTIATTAPVLEEGAGPASEGRTGRLVCISVSDTGCGIPPENLRRLFEPFFTTKGVGKGTGLGLATTYGIVKQHRGWIHVNSELGQGTTFQIFLPASTQASETPINQVNIAPVRGGKESILVVEDESTLRKLVRMVLEKYGYTVFEACTGRSALAVWEAQQRRIDLVLTDMVMPDGMSGRELVQELQRQRPRIKVVFTSGYSPEVIANGLSLEEGVNFLQKPYDPPMLAGVVRTCLDTAG